jgi:fibronectin-binding autotransporter adhesin
MDRLDIVGRGRFRRRNLLASVCVGAMLLIATPAWAIDVANQTDWNTAVAAVASAGAGSTVTINVTSGFTLTASLAALQTSNANVTINITGNNQTVDGGSTFQGIQVSGTNAPTVNIASLAVVNTKAVGGTGGAGQAGFFSPTLSYGSGGGGGGGLGAGGGLSVGSGANVTLSAVTFTGNNVTGGTGGNGGVAQNTASSVTGGNGGDGGSLNGAGAVGGGGAGGAGGNTGTQGTGGAAGSAFGAGGGGGGGSGTLNSPQYTANNQGGAGSAGGGIGRAGGDGVTNNDNSQGPGADGGSGGNGGNAQGGAIYVAPGGTVSIVDTGITGATAAGGAGGGSGTGQGPDNFSGSPGGAGAAQGAALFIGGGGATIGVSSGNAQTYANDIAGAGGVIKTGAGTLTLTSTNTYAGGTSINGGTLNAGSAGALGTTGTISFGGGTLQYSAANQTNYSTRFSTAADQAYSIDTNGQNVTFATALTSVNGTLAKLGSGTLTLSGANTYSGATTINGGTLALSGATGSVANSSGVALATGATFDISGLTNGGTSVVSLGDTAAGQAGTVNLGANGLTVSNANASFGGVIQGTGGFTLSAGAQTLTGTNTYTGATTINGGTLALSGTSSVANSSGVALATGATFDISGLTNGGTSIVSLGNTAAGQIGTVNLGANRLTLSNANASFGGIVQGTGGVTLTGGTETLSGANTYSGTTTINGGRLALSATGSVANSRVALATGATLDISGLTNGGTSIVSLGNTAAGQTGTVNLGANRLTLSNANASFGGVIQGTGGFTLSAGTQTLTGANTYTGGTAIDGGTLLISGGGTLGGTTGATTLSGGVLDLGGTTQTQNGGLTLNGGTIRNGTLSSSGAFTFESGTIDAALTGFAGFDKTGAGTLTINVVSTYTGVTDIHGGTLAIGAGGSVAASSLIRLDTAGTTFDISAGGNQTIQDLAGVSGSTVALGANTLTFGTGNSGGFAGVINGTGGITKVGAGAITLSGVNAYTGATTIADGALAVGAGGSIASSSGVDLTGSAAVFEAFSDQTINDLAGVAGSKVTVTGTNILTFGTANSTTFAGSFTGSGGLVKNGAGIFTLTGDSSAFTGSTTINAGTVALGSDAQPDASLGGDVTVVGGTLKGFGTIGGSLANNGGIVAPGGSIGTLTVNGAFTQGANGTLSIEVSPTAASKLAVGGAASLDGKLALVFDPGVYHATTYTLLSASAVSGKFASVTGTNPTGLKQSVLYQAADVTLQLGAASTGGGGGGGTVTPPPPVMVVKPTNDTIYTSVTSAAVIGAQAANTVILDRPDAQPVDPQQPMGRGAWMHSFGGFASLNGNSTAPGFTAQAGGFLAGYDQAVMDNAYLGLAGGYQHTDTNEHSTSDGKEDSARFAVYGGVSAGPSLFTGTAGYAHDWLDTTRRIAGIGKAGESHGGDEATVAGQWSLPVPISGFGGSAATLTPKAGFQYVHLSEDGFADAGARGFDLHSGDRDTDSFQPFAGVSAAQTFVTASGGAFTPDIHLGFGYDVLPNSRNLVVTTVSGDNFQVAGVKPSRAQVTAGAGFNFVCGPNLSLYGKYDSVLYTGNASYQDISAGLRWQF